MLFGRGRVSTDEVRFASLMAQPAAIRAPSWLNQQSRRCVETHWRPVLGLGVLFGRGRVSTDEVRYASLMAQPAAGRGPKIAVPIRTQVEPSRMAIRKSPDIPMLNSSQPPPTASRIRA